MTSDECSQIFSVIFFFTVFRLDGLRKLVFNLLFQEFLCDKTSLVTSNNCFEIPK